MKTKELIRLSIEGDRDAFGELYDVYRDKLYRWAFYRLGNRQDAEDAVSDPLQKMRTVYHPSEDAEAERRRRRLCRFL